MTKFFAGQIKLLLQIPREMFVHNWVGPIQFFLVNSKYYIDASNANFLHSLINEEPVFPYYSAPDPSKICFMEKSYNYLNSVVSYFCDLFIIVTFLKMLPLNYFTVLCR